MRPLDTESIASSDHIINGVDDRESIITGTTDSTDSASVAYDTTPHVSPVHQPAGRSPAKGKLCEILSFIIRA